LDLWIVAKGINAGAKEQLDEFLSGAIHQTVPGSLHPR